MPDLKQLIQRFENAVFHEAEGEYRDLSDKALTRRSDAVSETRKALMGAYAQRWQPIETAPRDGTRILFYTPHDPETGWLEFVAESHYDKHGLVDTFVSQWQDGLEPTHWMPLPDPPEVKD